MSYFFKTAQQYDNLSFFADKIDICYGVNLTKNKNVVNN